MTSISNFPCSYKTDTPVLAQQCLNDRYRNNDNYRANNSNTNHNSITWNDTSIHSQTRSSPLTPKKFRTRRLVGTSSELNDLDCSVILTTENNNVVTKDSCVAKNGVHQNTGNEDMNSSPPTFLPKLNTISVPVPVRNSLSISPASSVVTSPRNSQSTARSGSSSCVYVRDTGCPTTNANNIDLTTRDDSMYLHGEGSVNNKTNKTKRLSRKVGSFNNENNAYANITRQHGFIDRNKDILEGLENNSENVYLSHFPMNHCHSVVDNNPNIVPSENTKSSNYYNNDDMDTDDVFDDADSTIRDYTLPRSSPMSTSSSGRLHVSNLKKLEDIVLKIRCLRSSQDFLSLLRHCGGKKKPCDYRRDRCDDRRGGILDKTMTHNGNNRDSDLLCRYNNEFDESSSGGSGYSGGDWCQGRRLSSESSSSSSSGDSVSMGSLSLLCAERVSQMTKTYNDIEAVSRLLEEKERDLELAARIGQTLLSKNKELTVKNECLDEQLSHANDRVNQLRHDLSLKEELLRFFNDDLENENKEDTSPPEPSEENLVNMDFLQKKVNTLENENLSLRLESADLKSTTESYEDKEKRLVEDCIKQLAEVNCQVETFAEELQHKAEENDNQKEQITKFLTQTADLQVKIRKLTVDNMDLHDKLTVSTDSQRKLTKELGRMQDKYDELYEMLEEAQVELHVMQGKHKLRATDKHHQNAYNVPTDSLASELETSLQQELAESNRRAQSWKIFETAKAAKRAQAKVGQIQHRHNLHQSLGSSSSMASSVRSMPLHSSAPSMSIRRRHDSDAVSCGYSAYTSDGESMNSDGYTADMDSLYGSNQELGRPGIPGSNDLESALRRLAFRRDNIDRGEMEAEESARRSRGRSEVSPSTTPRLYSPGGMSTPSSCLSVPGSVCSPSHSGAAATLKSSDKLKIMKPLEGSVTLRHWQHLATPHLGGIFESREGVQLKGERRLDLDDEVVYCLSDYEEDDIGGHHMQGTPSTLVHSLIDAAVRSPGLSQDWAGLHDPRTPSPGLAYYSHQPSSSHLTPSTFHNKPMQTSTPVLHSAFSTSNLATNNNNNNYDRHPGSGDGMSLGLAALLDSSDAVSGGGGMFNRNKTSLRGPVIRGALPISNKKSLFSSEASSSTSSSPLMRKNQNDFNNLLSSLSTAAFTSTLSSSSNSSSCSDFNKKNTKYPGSNSGAAISTGDVVSTSTHRPGSILMATQNLTQRYRSVPGSKSFEDMSAANTNVKVTVAGAGISNVSSLSSPSVVSTSSLSLPISSSSISSTLSSTEDKNSWVFSPGMTGQGFLQQLKSRGFSLYGLWANATAVASANISSTEASSSSFPTSSSASNNNSSPTTTSSRASSTVDGINVANINRNVSSASLPGLNLMSRHTSSPIDLEADELLNSPTATTTTVSTVPASGGGVFGVYSGFRRGRML